MAKVVSTWRVEDGKVHRVGGKTRKQREAYYDKTFMRRKNREAGLCACGRDPAPGRKTCVKCNPRKRGKEERTDP